MGFYAEKKLSQNYLSAIIFFKYLNNIHQVPACFF